MKKTVIIFGIIIMIILGIALFSEKDPVSIFDSEATETITVTDTDEITNYVKMVVNDEAVIIIELYEDEAPITVQNFQNLVYENYYDGLVFHRIINEFMIQGGSGDDVDTIVGEFENNGIENNILHEEGVISMARSTEYDSASSQFFICLSTIGCEHLDGDYAAFGKVIYGLNYVQDIGDVETDDSDYPLEEVVITSMSFVNIEE